jgi:hypothetical protein
MSLILAQEQVSGARAFPLSFRRETVGGVRFRHRRTLS